jgi:diguanylate cyclase (GGDEF)-like protein
MTDDAAMSGGTSPLALCKRLYDQAARLVCIGAFERDLATEALSWTDGVYDLFELPRGRMVKRAEIVELYEEESRAEMERLRARALRGGGRFTLDARIRTSGGARRWMRLTGDVAMRDGKPVRLFGAKQDITHEKELWDRLRRLAERDPLTGLANRAVFEARLGELGKIDEGDEALSALVLIDVDRFKEINDRFGHSAGDECLRRVAASLAHAFRDAVLLARIGGDEFVALLHAPSGRAQLDLLLARALRLLCQPVFWHARRVDMGVSIGVALVRGPERPDPARLFAEADSALYLAKAAGRGAVRVFGEPVDGGIHLDARSMPVQRAFRVR